MNDKDVGLANKAAGFIGLILLILGTGSMILRFRIGFLDFLILAVSLFTFYKTLVKKKKLILIEWIVFLAILALVVFSFVLGLWYATMLVSRLA